MQPIWRYSACIVYSYLIIPPTKKVATLSFDKHMVTHEKLIFFLLVFVAKLKSTEDAAYLKIFSLYSILISDDSPHKKNVTHIILKSVW